MKRMICLALAALVSCLVAALAEGGGMEGTWVCPEDDALSLDIWTDEAEYDVLGIRFVSEEELVCVEFEKCVYDAVANVLSCENGTLTHEVSVAADGEEEEEEETIETLASGFGATLSLDEDGLLRWTGSGDAVPDRAFALVRQDDGRFVGDWVCGDYEMTVDMENEDYEVSIILAEENKLVRVWEYACTLDPETGALKGVGARQLVDQSDDGAPAQTVFATEDGSTAYAVDEETGAVTRVNPADYAHMDEDEAPTLYAYTDGEATFTFTGEAILWDDAMEDAGRELVFVRSPEEVEDDDDDVIDEDDTSLAG